MSWRDQLQQASFRGVMFQVDTATDYIGREKVLREYPFQDKPTIQDVGGVSKPGSFSAYVFGEDAFARRDELVRALNKPGPGDLVHPWMGVRRVEILGPVPMRHSTAEGGVIRFDIEFIEADSTRYPTATKNTSRILQGSVLTARVKAVEDFAKSFAVEKLAGWAQDSSLGAVFKAITDIQTSVKTIVGIPAGFLAGFDTQSRLFGNTVSGLLPADIGAGLMGLLTGLSDYTGNTRSQEPDHNALASSDETKATRRQVLNATLKQQQTLFIWSSNYQPSQFETPTRLQEQSNHMAVDNLIQTASVLAAAQTISQSDFSQLWSYAEAMQWRAVINTAFQRVLEKADSNIYNDLLATMTAVSDDIVTRARHLGRVSVINTRDVYMSAMLVSYEQYGTIDLADEIVSNNNIENPLFIEPSSRLEILSHA